MMAGLFEAMIKSLWMTVLSEIGDKTFFIAAVMAMKQSRVVVFFGAWGALLVMTALSASMGWAAPALLSRRYTHLAATGLFFFFGIKLVYAAAVGSGEGVQEELAEVEAELGVGGNKSLKRSASFKKNALQKLMLTVLSPVLLEVFTLTFLAEWGDRSQIATIGLAAQDNPLGVTLGGVLGHAMCTGGAVMG
eukprot:CAMPEP_0182857666 /NCGR_PEP_ID=MMETSP0034_2-20130328/3187_1 /TAXON_ID=156128 /ORGANISM="Nephroselmis pyriformis, Strain CCMP717" /LENGTH=191 /DNA_ID=CAMNT_0024988929 /DNA_START=230 /DNA_END=801 /DNA_ORIENTATION=-